MRSPQRMTIDTSHEEFATMVEYFSRLLIRGWRVIQYLSEYGDGLHIALQSPKGAYPVGGDYPHDSETALALLEAWANTH